MCAKSKADAWRHYTNSFRAGGAWIGLLTGASDILKGHRYLGVQALLRDQVAETLPWMLALGGICAVIGHNVRLHRLSRRLRAHHPT